MFLKININVIILISVIIIATLQKKVVFSLNTNDFFTIKLIHRN